MLTFWQLLSKHESAPEGDSSWLVLTLTYRGAYYACIVYVANNELVLT